MPPMTEKERARRALRAAARKRRRGGDLIAEGTRELVAAFDAAIAAGISAHDAAALAGMTKQNVYALRKRVGQ